MSPCLHLWELAQLCIFSSDAIFISHKWSSRVRQEPRGPSCPGTAKGKQTRGPPHPLRPPFIGRGSPAGPSPGAGRKLGVGVGLRAARH